MGGQPGRLPAVMLSPNARNLVCESSGIRETVTEKLQAAAPRDASRAEHDTVVVPVANVVPLTGMQLVLTGADPPEVIGAAKVIEIGFPSGDSTS
jgi:hypothetical protein